MRFPFLKYIQISHSPTSKLFPSLFQISPFFFLRAQRRSKRVSILTAVEKFSPLNFPFLPEKEGEKVRRGEKFKFIDSPRRNVGSQLYFGGEFTLTRSPDFDNHSSGASAGNNYVGRVVRECRYIKYTCLQMAPRYA